MSESTSRLAWALISALLFIQFGTFFAFLLRANAIAARWREFCRQQSEQHTRAEKLARLDSYLQNSPWLTMLRRATIMAPLVGVIITARGFMTLDTTKYFEAQETGSLAILQHIQPLFLGVFVGAVLALGNQFLLFLTGWKVRSVRDREELELPNLHHDQVDDAFRALAYRINGVGTEFQALVGESTRNATQRITGFLDACGRLTSEIERVGTSYERSAEGLRRATQTFDSTLREAVGGITGDLTTFGAVIRNAGDALTVSVRNYSTVSDEATASLSEMVKGLSAITVDLRTLASGSIEHQSAALENTLALRRGTSQFTEIASNLGTLVTEAVIPEISATLGAVLQAREQITTLADETARLNDGITMAAKGVLSLSTSSGSAEKELVKSVEGLTTGAGDFAEGVRGMEQVLTTGLTRQEEVFGRLQELVSSIASIRAGLDGLCRQLDKEVRPALSETSGGLRESKDVLARASGDLNGTLSRFTDSFGRLVKGTDGVANAETRLTTSTEELGKHIARLIRTTEAHETALRRIQGERGVGLLARLWPWRRRRSS